MFEIPLILFCGLVSHQHFDTTDHKFLHTYKMTIIFTGELSKVPDVRKQAQLESAEHRCAKLQHEIDAIMAGQVSFVVLS